MWWRGKRGRLQLKHSDGPSLNQHQSEQTGHVAVAGDVGAVPHCARAGRAHIAVCAVGRAARGGRYS